MQSPSPAASKYYPYEQILLVYSKDPTFGILAAVSENVNTESKAALSQNLEEEKANAAALQDNLKEALTRITVGRKVPCCQLPK